MTTRTVTVTICDLCSAEQADQTPVTSHRISFDKKAVKVDLCGGCMADVSPVLERLLKSGERIKRKD